MKVVRSASNSNVKRWVQLRRAKTRRATGLFAVEGIREIRHGIEAGFPVTEVVVCEPMLNPAGAALLSQISGATRFAVPPSLFAKLAVRENADGLFVVFSEAEPVMAADLLPRPNPLVLGLWGLEKPGNVGAILRSCDGAGVDAVFLIDCAIDRFNPNLIRASLGSVFRLPVLYETCDGFVSYCQDNRLALSVCTQGHDSVNYAAWDYTGPTAIVLGSESLGVGNIPSDACLEIPMRGALDSLNVSAAAAIVIYEAVRQRSDPRSQPNS